MIGLKEKFIVDDNGNRVEVIIDYNDYERLLEELEEAESIKQYDLAKSRNDEIIPFDIALKEIGLQWA